MKRLISALCASAILAAIPALGVSAKDVVLTEDGITYTFAATGNGELVINDIKADHDITALKLPSEADGKKIVGVTQRVFVHFEGSGSIKEIIIPSGYNGFKLGSLANLESVTLPDDLTEIPKQCFSGCTKLKDIAIPDTVAMIGDEGFFGCRSLEKVNIPDGVTDIGVMSFMECDALKSITIPDSVEHIRQEAFHGCSALAEIKWNEDKAVLDDNVFTGTPYLREGRDTCILTDNGKTFYSWGGKDKTVEIPEGVTAIAHGAFMESDIEKVICPESMTVISNLAFADTDNLKEVEFKGVVTKFEPSAFSYCSALTKLNIPKTVTAIPELCFNYCKGLTEIEIPDTITGIGQYAFYGCENIKSIKFSNNCSIIPWGCFGMCNSLTEVTIPDCVKKIEDEAFAQCSNLAAVSMRRDVELGNAVFAKTPYNNVKKTPEPTLDPLNKDSEEPEGIPRSTAAPSETAEPAETSREPIVTNTPSDTEKGTIDVKTGDTIEVEVNEKPVIFPDAQPYIDSNDRTLIPIRVIAEALGCKVDWNGETNTAVITKGDKVIYITIGDNILRADGESITMDTAAEVREDRTYIPLRFVGEALDMKVNWIGN